MERRWNAYICSDNYSEPSSLIIALHDKTLVSYRQNSFKIHVTFGPRLYHWKNYKQQKKTTKWNKYDEDFYESRECVKFQVWHNIDEMKGRQREGGTKKSMFALAVGLMPVRCNMNNFDAAALWRDQSWNSFHSSKLATVAALMSPFIRKYHYLIDIFYFYLKIFFYCLCDAQVSIIWCSLAKNYYFFHAQLLCTIFGLCSRHSHGTRY